MDTFQSLLMGFSIALTPQNLLFAFAGSLLGTLIGVLPGIGPVAGVAILIPLTFELEPIGAIIMLSAIFYGTQYGGTITSVLLNTPGEAASAITCIEGYEMAKKGRAGSALSIAAIGSFIGGTLSTIGLVLAAPPLTRLALQFGPPEFFGLMVLGISLLMGLAGKSMLKALMAGIFGMLLALIGMDPVHGLPRFTFGRMELMEGISFVPVIMGLFGLGEILSNAENALKPAFLRTMSSLVPSRQEARDSVLPILRGTGIGFGLGLIPGMTGTASAFLSYVAERKSSKHPERFGSGIIEGVAGPETANNAHAIGALVPLFAVGIPASPTVAVLMGAFIMNGLIPGPYLFKEHPDVAWGVIASLYIGNVMLLVLNLPLIRMWVKILEIPYSILFALILTFMVIGAYSINNSIFDVVTMTIFGVVGYALRKLDFPLAPAVLTLILGPMMERSLRQSLDMSQGDFSIFYTRPLTIALLAIALLIVLSPLLRFLRLRKASALQGDAEV
ncbi:MAG: tripartite tricarboxylate transporter permease [Sphingomonadaceae bacterium]